VDKVKTIKIFGLRKFSTEERPCNAQVCLRVSGLNINRSTIKVVFWIWYS